MTMEMLGRLRGEVDPADARRLARSCTHGLVPAHPAEAGYRYHDLGGEHPPFYLRRFRLGERSAAVSLTAPVERSWGLDAEPGAAAVARVELHVGARTIPWNEMVSPRLGQGDSALLARAALEAVIDLQLLERDGCPLCAGANDAPAQGAS
jgi:hypothetical protein